MSKTIEAITGDVSTDLAALRQDVARLTEKLGELIQDKVHGAGSAVSAAAGGANTMVTAAAADAKNAIQTAGLGIESHIERNPMMAALAAFGIGMALGLLNRPRG